MLEASIHSRCAEELHFAIQKGERARLSEEELRNARNALTQAAEEALERAVHSGQTLEQLARAIEDAQAAGVVRPGALHAARRVLLETAIRERSSKVQRMLEAAIRSRGVEELSMAIKMGEWAGFSGEGLRAARDALVDARAARAAEEKIESGVRSRSLEQLARAIEEAEANPLVEVGVLQEARRVMEEWQTAQQVAWEECIVCFEKQVTSVMPCCGRPGSGNRICAACLARVGACPFCRAPLKLRGAASFAVPHGLVLATEGAFAAVLLPVGTA